jgi:hypothetical protein
MLRLTRLPEDMNDANASALSWKGQDCLTFRSKAMDNPEHVQYTRGDVTLQRKGQPRGSL